MTNTAVLMGSLSAACACFDFLQTSENFDLRAVVCRDDDPRQEGEDYLIDRAREHGVPIYNLDTMPEADIGVAVRFDRILRGRHRDRFRLGVVNLHGAPLPEMRGSLCEVAAILEERESFGTSLHLMDDGIDTGPILAVERFPIGANATAGELLREANRRGVAMIEARLQPYAEGTLIPRAQDLSAGRTYRKAEVLALKQPSSSAKREARDRVERAFCYDPKGWRPQKGFTQRLAAFVEHRAS
jgi:methionyl-tRNA formyltransferase